MADPYIRQGGNLMFSSISRLFLRLEGAKVKVFIAKLDGAMIGFSSGLPTAWHRGHAVQMYCTGRNLPFYLLRD